MHPGLGDMFAGASMSCVLQEQVEMTICSGTTRGLIVCCSVEWWEEGPRGPFSSQRLLPTPCALASFAVSVVIVVKQTVDSSV